MNARSEAHRSFEDGGEVFLQAAVHHRARRIIQRPQQHTREGQRHVVLGIGVFAPLVLLEPAHAFNIHEVGPGSGHRRRSNRAMKINQHVAASSLAANLVIEIHHHLIVSLHEINF